MLHVTVPDPENSFDTPLYDGPLNAERIKSYLMPGDYAASIVRYPDMIPIYGTLEVRGAAGVKFVIRGSFSDLDYPNP